MRKSIISLTVASLVATSLYAESANVNDAFKNGTFSGDASLHYQHQENDTTTDSGYSNGSFGLNYSTDSVNGFSLNAGFRANGQISEEEDGDYDDSDAKAVMHTANITYSKDNVGAVVVGRQEIALEWITDYHEAVVGVLSAVPNLTLVAGYTQKLATADFDEPVTDFTKFNGDKGAYVLDATYNIAEIVSLNGYYMDAPDLFSAVGGGATVNLEPITLLGKYAQTDEDTTTLDGDIYQLEVGADLGMFNASIGFIDTDKDGGIGTLSALGDNINLFEDGNQVYSADASTYYAMLSADIGPVETYALYGNTDYSDFEEKELNVGGSMELVKNLTGELLFVDVDADEQDGQTDYQKYVANLIYSF